MNARARACAAALTALVLAFCSVGPAAAATLTTQIPLKPAPTTPAATAAPGPKPKTTITAVWNDLMCPSCHETLAIADSPQALAERGFVEHLIAEGDTRAQVMRTMVQQYGNAVLAKPPAGGFNLALYILPPALLAAGVAFLLFTLPKWRARGREAAALPMAGGAAALSPEDAARLERDLSLTD